MTTTTVATYKCDTVGELLDHLAEIAKDNQMASVLDSSIESYGEVFDGFKITKTTLSDKSTVLNFEFVAVTV